MFILEMVKKRGGFIDSNSSIPLIQEISNVANLDYQKQYESFNYDKYINAIKTSNFAGGCNKKYCPNKFKKILQDLYIRYINGKPSNIRQSMRGGMASLNQNFNVPYEDMQNVAGLDYQNDWQYADIRRISHVPTSNFEV